MRLRLAALAALAALLLGGCAAIPTSGPVNEGGGEVTGSEPFVPFAEGPRAGDGPVAIISGFIKATAAGFASDFSVAREYLTTEASTEWDPLKEIVVFDSGALTPDYDEAALRVTYSVPVAERIDAGGRMVEAEDGTQTQLEFVVAQERGEWRISELEDGSLIAQANFNQVFLAVSLVFASPDATTAVPEVRWLPRSNVATWAARELIAGPSPWLADAVRTGFAAGATMTLDSVVVTDGDARVALNAQAAATPEDRDLAEQQLILTLTALPGIRSVTVTAGGLPLGTVDPTVTLSREPIPDAVAAAIAGARLGLWDGTELRVTPDAVGAVPAGADALAWSYGAQRAALRVDGSRILVSDALAGGLDSLEPVPRDAEPPAIELDGSTVLEGVALLPPAFDRFGWLWSGESAEPEVLTVVPAGGEPIDLEASWLAGRAVLSATPSRDGSRLLVVSRAGTQTVVEVAGVVRGQDGAPLSVGEPLQVGANIGDTVDAIWVDDVTVALLGASTGADSTPLWLVTVGGRTVADAAVPDAVSLTARHGERSITVVSADGTVRVRAGTGWSAAISGVSDLAFAG